MKRFLAFPALAVLLVLPACDGDSSSGPDPTFENVAGTWEGVAAGASQGATLEVTVSITVEQSDGTLSGTSSLVGTLNDGVDIFDIQGSSTFTGTIASGQNPSVNTTNTDDACPNRQTSFSGSLDSANDLITTSGPIEILDENCVVLLTFEVTIIFSRL